jgi:hypothetical protein
LKLLKEIIGSLTYQAIKLAEPGSESPGSGVKRLPSVAVKKLETDVKGYSFGMRDSSSKE